MKKILVPYLLSSLVCNFAFAATYKLDFVVEVPNAAPTHGTIVTEEGKTVTISSDTLSVDLVPTTQPTKDVKIKAEIWEKATHSRVGGATLITKLNQLAKITESADDGTQKFSLTVTPSTY